MRSLVSRLGLRAIALLYLAVILVGPLAIVFWRTFEDGFGPAWDALTTPETLNAFKLTLIITAIAVPVNTVFGIVCALAIVRKRFPGKGVLNAFIDLPLALSPVVVGLFPVRAVYPAEVRVDRGAGQAPSVAVPGFDGRGVDVGLLDSGVDRSHPSLMGHLRMGYDLVERDADASAEMTVTEGDFYGSGQAQMASHQSILVDHAWAVAPAEPVPSEPVS